MSKRRAEPQEFGEEWGEDDFDADLGVQDEVQAAAQAEQDAAWRELQQQEHDAALARTVSRERQDAELARRARLRGVGGTGRVRRVAYATGFEYLPPDNYPEVIIEQVPKSIPVQKKRDAVRRIRA